MNHKQKQSRKNSKSLLNWLAGNNRPDALGYTAIDPKRWQQLMKLMKNRD
jgi:hypothetical protein